MTHAPGNLADLTLAELKSLYAKVAEEIEHARKRDLDAARTQIQEIARSVGLSVHEIAGAKTKGNIVKEQKAPLAAVYRNPANSSQQWSGRGRPPAWVKDRLAAGGNIEDFRITKR